MKNPSFAKLLRRARASQYLLEVHGVARAATTLAADACRGTGPEIEYINRVPHYRPSALDAYVKALLGTPTKQARKYAQPRNPARAGVKAAALSD